MTRPKPAAVLLPTSGAAMSGHAHRAARPPAEPIALESGRYGPEPPRTACFTQHGAAPQKRQYRGGSTAWRWEPWALPAWPAATWHQPAGTLCAPQCLCQAHGVLHASISQWRELSPASRTPRGPRSAPTPTKGGLSPGLKVACGGPGCSHDARSCPAQLLFCFNKSAAAGPAQPPAHAVLHRLGSQLDVEKGMYSGGQAGWAAERKKTAAMKTCSLCKEPWKGCAAQRAAGWQWAPARATAQGSTTCLCSVPCSPAQLHRATSNSSDHPQPSPCCSPNPTGTAAPGEGCGVRRGLSDCMLCRDWGQHKAGGSHGCTQRYPQIPCIRSGPGRHLCCA